MQGMIEYLQVKYGDEAVMWAYSDDPDQKKYSDKYFEIIEGLKSLGEVNSMYVKIALFKAIAADEQFLIKILQRYS